MKICLRCDFIIVIHIVGKTFTYFDFFSREQISFRLEKYLICQLEMMEKKTNGRLTFMKPKHLVVLTCFDGIINQ